MSSILTYPVIVSIGTIALTWLFTEIHKNNVKFQKYLLLDLKNDLRLVEAKVYPLDIFADRLEDLGGLLLIDEDTQSLLANIVKVAIR